ncbi:hypothetical protein TNIN_223241 [Trichonephila inaurata madagascariensis]|uniref:Uncharacterized protein n=1 Tax=Trichonephila inaurata madagascariensis TaxID=2747483 RepID=A0A8X7CK15_9ARAC|nr:hypothetical protein TNIN_223241 [Trichonephila inaurata madagascariensis]
MLSCGGWTQGGLVGRISRGIEVGGGQNIRHPIRHVINPVRSLMELNLQLQHLRRIGKTVHQISTEIPTFPYHQTQSLKLSLHHYLFLPENRKLRNPNWGKEFSTPNRNCHSLAQFDTDSDNRHRQHPPPLPSPPEGYLAQKHNSNIT